MKRILIATLLALAISTNAAADVGPGLYVSESGSDEGDCSDVERPCRSILYALDVAGKNTRIHVAVGRYTFDDPAAILYAMSGAVHVHGGYVEDDQGQWIKGGKATLTSVPPGYREFFSMHGFIVVSDAKGDEDWPADGPAMLAQHRRLEAGVAAEDCTGGSAGGLACSDIDLLSHTARSEMSSNPGRVADIWGFVDLNSRREYVIVGVQNGTAVFDVTDTARPVEIGFIGGKSATWRDIKVLQRYDANAERWRAYAYVTTDGAQENLLIIDLSALPHAIGRLPYASDFTNAHNVYVTDTDYSTGVANASVSPRLVVAGAGVDAGQFRLYSLDDPANPVFLGRDAGGGYMHDASSLRIEDARASECSGSVTACTVVLDFNEENVELWDIGNPATPARLAVVPAYANLGYVHSGWWSEDRRHVFVHDELDERRTVNLQTTVRVLSLASLTSPTLAGSWTGSTGAVDHNGFVRGNRYYMATYTRGLTILDITDPASPTEAGYFDTYPTDNGSTFAGAWGAYPYLPSGAIAVSDINSGLYLLGDATRDVPAGRLGFDAAAYGVEEGQSIGIGVARTGGMDGAVSTGWELVGLTADADDVQLAAGRLDWADGDSGIRTIDVAAVADAEVEPLEELMLRLVDPTGGATLGDIGSTSLFVGEAGAASTLVLYAADVTVAEGGPGIAVVTVQRRGAAAGAVTVDYAVTTSQAAPGSDFIGPDSGTLAWDDGDARPKTLAFEILDDGIDEEDETFELSFTNLQGATFEGSERATITILDGSAVNQPPSVSAGDDQTRTAGTNVMLDGSATFDPDGDALTYAWTQESGPIVTLAGRATEAATFVAPSVGTEARMEFRLTVTDARGASAAATTVVTVTPTGGGDSSVRQSGGSGAPSPWLLVVLAFGALARAVAVSRRGSAG